MTTSRLASPSNRPFAAISASSGNCGALKLRDCRLARHGAALIVVDGKAAIRRQIDAVGAGAQAERPARRREGEFAAQFAEQLRSAAPLGFGFGEPAGKAFQPRPPEGADPRTVAVKRSALVEDGDEFAGAILRQRLGKAAGEAVQHIDG